MNDVQLRSLTNVSSVAAAAALLSGEGTVGTLNDGRLMPKDFFGVDDLVNGAQNLIAPRETPAGAGVVDPKSNQAVNQPESGVQRVLKALGALLLGRTAAKALPAPQSPTSQKLLLAHDPVAEKPDIGVAAALILGNYDREREALMPAEKLSLDTIGKLAGWSKATVDAYRKRVEAEVRYLTGANKQSEALKILGRKLAQAALPSYSKLSSADLKKETEFVQQLVTSAPSFGLFSLSRKGSLGGLTAFSVDSLVNIISQAKKYL